MGVCSNVRMIVGAKIESVDQLFTDEKVVKFGCEHKVTGSKYCPECGRHAQEVYTIKTPLLPMTEDESSWGIKILDDKFSVIYDPNWYSLDVYVAVYVGELTSINYSLDPPVFLSREELNERLLEAEGMVEYLVSKGVALVSNEPSVFVIPYYS